MDNKMTNLTNCRNISDSKITCLSLSAGKAQVQTVDNKATRTKKGIHTILTRSGISHCLSNRPPTNGVRKEKEGTLIFQQEMNASLRFKRQQRYKGITTGKWGMSSIGTISSRTILANMQSQVLPLRASGYMNELRHPTQHRKCLTNESHSMVISQYQQLKVLIHALLNQNVVVKVNLKVLKNQMRFQLLEKKYSHQRKKYSNRRILKKKKVQKYRKWEILARGSYYKNHSNQS